MDNLPSVQPLSLTPGPVEEISVLLTITGLDSGWYRTRDLYPRFVAVEERLGNTPPSTPARFGMALAKLDLESQLVRGNCKAWYLSSEVLERAAEMSAKVERYLDPA